MSAVRHTAYPNAPTQVNDLVSLIDLGPTILEAAGITLPDYFEGRSLLPFLRGEAGGGHEFVFCEDNYQIMMRDRSAKLVYYIGQEAGELYDLARDPHELWNRWTDPDYIDLKTRLLRQLLDWLAGSAYFNAGYKQGLRNYQLRWPDGEHTNLHGPATTSDGFTKRW